MKIRVVCALNFWQQFQISLILCSLKTALILSFPRLSQAVVAELTNNVKTTIDEEWAHMDDADLGCDKFLACAGELDYIIIGICKPDTLLRSQVSSPACNHALRASGRIRNTPMKF